MGSQQRITMAEVAEQYGFTEQQVIELNSAMHVVWGNIAYDAVALFDCDESEIADDEKVEFVCDANRLEFYSGIHHANPDALNILYRLMKESKEWNEVPLAIWRAQR